MAIPEKNDRLTVTATVTVGFILNSSKDTDADPSTTTVPVGFADRDRSALHLFNHVVLAVAMELPEEVVV